MSNRWVAIVCHSINRSHASNDYRAARNKLPINHFMSREKCKGICAHQRCCCCVRWTREWCENREWKSQQKQQQQRPKQQLKLTLAKSISSQSSLRCYMLWLSLSVFRFLWYSFHCPHFSSIPFSCNRYHFDAVILTVWVSCVQLHLCRRSFVSCLWTRWYRIAWTLKDHHPYTRKSY